MAVTGKAYDFPILKRILAFTKPYKSAFVTSVVLTLLIAFLSPVRPILIQYTLDHDVATGNFQGLINMTLIMVGLLLLQTGIQYYHIYLTNWLGQVVIRDMRIELYEKILRFRHKYFDHTPIGNLVTRTISDLETVADVFSEGIIVIIGDLLQVVVIVLVMFWIDWRLALVSLSTIPVLLIATNIFKNGIKEAFKEVRTQVAHLNTFVQEHVTGMSVVQIFNREDAEMKKFEGINYLHRKAHIKSVWYYSVFFPVVEILSATSMGLLIWWGAGGVLKNQVSVGDLVAFIMYISMLFRPIRELADKFNTLQMGMVSSERIFKVLDTKEEIANTANNDNRVTKGHIEFKNVWFAYNDEDWILRDLSFEVKPGQTLALVGATGAGKSSVIQLLNRSYELNKGSILVDGIDVRDYTLENLRSAIAVVLQDVFLFSDTIENNITLKDKTITREEVRKAAEMIGANHFIERLPGSYSFNVMERGAVLSVGQRQLISFIRAYVFNPKILILDEATSSIDTESEELIQQATGKLTYNRTSVVIAHRLSTIQSADKIIVLDKGEKKEEGTHQELLAHNGLYKKLYEIQFEKMDVEV